MVHMVNCHCEITTFSVLLLKNLSTDKFLTVLLLHLVFSKMDLNRFAPKIEAEDLLF